MTPAQIITMARNLTKAHSTNIDDTTMYQYLNIAYHRMENLIVDKVDEDYFWDIFTASTVADQNEYTLQAATATQE